MYTKAKEALRRPSESRICNGLEVSYVRRWAVYPFPGAVSILCHLFSSSLRVYFIPRSSFSCIDPNIFLSTTLIYELLTCNNVHVAQPYVNTGLVNLLWILHTQGLGLLDIELRTEGGGGLKILEFHIFGQIQVNLYTKEDQMIEGWKVAKVEFSNAIIVKHGQWMQRRNVSIEMDCIRKNEMIFRKENSESTNLQENGRGRNRIWSE